MIPAANFDIVEDRMTGDITVKTDFTIKAESRRDPSWADEHKRPVWPFLLSAEEIQALRLREAPATATFEEAVAELLPPHP